MCLLFPALAVMTNVLLNVVGAYGALNDCCAKTSLGIQVIIRYGLTDRLMSLMSIG